MRRQDISCSPRAWMMLQVVVFMCVAAAHAQIDLPLPGVEGTHEYSELTGWVTVPPATGAQSVRLVIAGSQVSGTIVNGCPPSQRAAGAEVHLVLSFAGIIDWLYCSANLLATDGDLVVELPCHAATWFYGPSEFRMYIGYHPDIAPVCWGYAPYPQLTIVTARLVAEAAVATESSSWGTVKGLFR
jgi:hypothetical protein